MFVTNSTGPFRYLTSLSDQAEPSIRLLELHKQSLFSTEIKISLEEYQCDATLPAYDTLSYAWGHDQRSKTILCNGKSFSVGVVLWQALSQLSRGPSYEKRLLWIDRICSNQDDAKEKSQQVALMRDIFARSRKTIAWLGSLIPREDLQTAQAIRELLQLTKVSLNLILTHCKDQAPKANWYRWISLPDSLAISVLLKRSWFVSFPLSSTISKGQYRPCDVTRRYCAA